MWASIKKIDWFYLNIDGYASEWVEFHQLAARSNPTLRDLFPPDVLSSMHDSPRGRHGYEHTVRVPRGYSPFQPYEEQLELPQYAGIADTLRQPHEEVLPCIHCHRNIRQAFFRELNTGFQHTWVIGLGMRRFYDDPSDEHDDNDTVACNRQDESAGRELLDDDDSE